MEYDLGVVFRRTTNIWRLKGIGQSESDMYTPLKIQPSIVISDLIRYKNHINNTFKFNKIQVKLITYKSILGIILINVLKTISE